MPYLTDNATVIDALDFEGFRDALREVITTAETPLTIGVFGAWGSGKTSLMRMLYSDIEQQGLYARRAVWFTAWKYDQQDALWRTLILRVITALYPRELGDGFRQDREILTVKEGSNQDKQIKLLNRLEESVYQAVDWEEVGPRAINWWQFIGGVGKAGLETAANVSSVGFYQKLKKMIGGDDSSAEAVQKAAQAISRKARQYHRRQLQFMEEFEKTFQEAVKLLDPTTEDSDDGRRLIVFVDDLDRCLPEKVVEVMEAIKLFLDVPGIIFVLGMDKDIVQSGIEAHYSMQFRRISNSQIDFPIDGDRYMQKIIQIPFYLPSLSVTDLEQYIGKLDVDMSELTRKVIAQCVLPNPRQVKRVLNIFNLLRTIANHRFKTDEPVISDPLLAKMALIQTQHPDFYQLWRQHPIVVKKLEEAYAREIISDDEILIGKEAGSETGKNRGGQGQLSKYLNNRVAYIQLAKILTYPSDKEAADIEAADIEAGRGRELSRFYHAEFETIRSICSPCRCRRN